MGGVVPERGRQAFRGGRLLRARPGPGRRGPGLRTLAQRGLAESLEAAGKFQEAVQEYNTLAADSQKAEARQETAEADWDVGRCYEHLGSIEQAKVFYAKAQELGGDSNWGNLARFGLESLSHPNQPQPKREIAPATPHTATSAAAPVASPTAPAPNKSDEKAVTEPKAAATPQQAGEAKPIPPEAEKPAGK